MCCTRRILGLALLALLANIGGRAGAYTNQWAAHIEGGPEVARQVAQDHGFRFLAKVRSKANAAAEKCRVLTKTFDESQSQHNRTLKDDQAPLCSRHTRSNHQTGKNTLIPQCVSQFLREKSVTSQMINRSLRNKFLRKIVNVSLIQGAQHFSTMASKSQLSTVPKKLLMPGTVDHKMVVRCAGQLRRCISTREKTSCLQDESNLDKFGARNFSRSASLEESCPIYDRKPAGFVNRYAEQKSPCETERSKQCRPKENVKEEELEKEEDCMKVMHSVADKKCRELEETATLRNTVSDQGRKDGAAEKCQGETHASLSGNSVLRPHNLQRTCNRPVTKKRSSYVIPRPCPTPQINIYDHSLPDPPPPRVAHWSERQMTNFGGRKMRFQTVKSSPMYYSPEQSIKKSAKPSAKSYFSLTGSKQRPASRARYSTSSEGKWGKEGKEGKEHSDAQGKAVEKRTWTKERMLRLLKRECAASKFLQRSDKKNNARTQESSRKREPSQESIKSEATPGGEKHLQVENSKPQKADVKCAESAPQFKRSQEASDDCRESTARRAKSERMSLSCEESAADHAKSQNLNDCCSESTAQIKRSQRTTDSCTESTARRAKSERMNLSCEESATDHTESQNVNDCCSESATHCKRSEKVSDCRTESTSKRGKSGKMSFSCDESATDHTGSQNVNDCRSESAAHYKRSEKISDCCSESAAHYKRSEKVSDCRTESTSKHGKPDKMSFSCEESATDHREPKNSNDCCSESTTHYKRSEKVSDCRTESTSKRGKPDKMSFSCEESATDHAKSQNVNDCCSESTAHYKRSEKGSDCCTESTSKRGKPDKMSFSCEESATDHAKSQNVNDCCSESDAHSKRSEKVSDCCTESTSKRGKPDKMSFSCKESATDHAKSQNVNDCCSESATEHRKFRSQDRSSGKTAFGQTKSEKTGASHGKSATQHSKPQKINAACAQSVVPHKKPQKANGSRAQPDTAHKKPEKANVSCAESSAAHERPADSSKTRKPPPSCNQNSHRQEKQVQEDASCSDPVGEHTKCTDSAKSKDTGQSCKAANSDVGRSKKENVTCAEPVDKNTECADSSNSKKSSSTPDSDQKCHQSCAKCGENSPLCPNFQKPTKSRSGKQRGQPISEHLMVEKVDVTCADHTDEMKKTVGPPKKPKPPPSCINNSQDLKCMGSDQKQAAAKKCTDEQPPKKANKPSQAASSPKCPEGLSLPKPTKTATDPPPVHILSDQGKLAPPKAGTIFHLSDICNCKPNVETLKYRLAKCPSMMEMRNVPESKRPTHRLPPRKKRDNDVLRSRSKVKKKETSGEWSRQRYIVRLRIFKAQDGFNPASPQMAEVKFGRSMDQSVDAQLQNMKKFEKHKKFVPQGTPPHRQQSQCAPKKCVLFKERDRMKRLKDSCAAQRNHEYYQRVMKKHGYGKKE